MTAYRINIGKTGTVIDMTDDDATLEVLTYLHQFAFRQILNNAYTSAYASAKEDGGQEKDWTAAGLAAVAKRKTAIDSGDLRAQRDTGGDPIQRRARVICQNKVMASDEFAAFLSQGGYKRSSDEALKWVKAKVDANVDKFRPLAEKQLADEADLDVAVAF